MKKVELLAPAGSFESFLGAIHAGADAVYIGGQKYGARAYAENFTEEEVCLAIRYAHLFGKKLYLTVNTLVKEEELKELPGYIRPFYEEGLDGVIIQDMGVFALLRECFPGLELHGSTQMTVTGARGARFLLEQGASRVVPARELSLTEIRKIKETGIEVEAFIHGAMCYCYSGQCLFSSMLGGRSGNRGRCAQPCRLPYQVVGMAEKPESSKGAKKGREKEEYPLSLKDMCTLSFLPELIEAGIDSFKIEGRMKKPEYAAGVTALYRKYIDQYYAAPEKDFRVSKEDMEKLRTLYIRSEIQEGYYHRHNGREMITPDKPSYLGVDEAYLKKIRETYLENPVKIPICGKLVLQKGQPARLEVWKETYKICQDGQLVDAAQKQPLTEETVRKQMGKTGNTPFAWEFLDICMEEDVFLPVKALNDLRRDALEQLENEMTSYARRSLPPSAEKAVPASAENEKNVVSASIEKKGSVTEKEDAYLAVQVQQWEQLLAVLKEKSADRIYLDADLLLEDGREALLEKLYAWKIEKEERKLFPVMPVIIRLSDEAYLNRLKEKVLSKELWDGILVRNLESLYWLKEQNWNREILADANLYAWNSHAKTFFEEMKISLTAPLECNKQEWHMLGLEGMETVVYGRSMLMVTANCIRKTKGQCLKQTGGKAALEQKTGNGLGIRDRYRMEFPVRTVCRHCYNEIYNSVPLSLHDYGKSIMGEHPAGVRLTFTTENEKEVQKVLTCFGSYTGEPDRKRQADFEYTKGHYKRGAE